MRKSILLCAVAGVTVLAMAGCGEQKDGAKKEAIGADCQPLAPAEAAQRDANDAVLIKINGKPAVFKQEFLEFAEQAMKANPYLSQFGITSYETAPAPIKEQLFEAMIQQKLITQWGCDNGVANTAEYKQTLAKTVEQLKQALMAQTFEKQILETVTVTDAEVEKEYTDNRERFVKDHGSVTVVGVPCTSDDQADAMFEAVAQVQRVSLSDAAAASGLNVKEFGKISKDPRLAMGSDISMAVRRAVFELADDAHFAKAADGDTRWVLQVVDRVAPTHMQLAEIKPQVEEMVRSNKFRAVRESRLKELRGAYTVDVDKSSLGADGPDPLAALQEALAQQGGEEERAATTSA